MNEQKEKGGKGNFTEDRQRSTEQGRKGGQGDTNQQQRPADQGRKGGQGQGSGGERNR